jgi:MFS family permease
MALAFNIFMTVWTVSLKERFQFGPRDHAFFMGWVGLCYALSQGLLAKLFIKMAGEDPTIVLLLCVLGLSVGRVVVMMTSSLVLVYAVMAGVIVALGVMNTAMATACSHLAGADQVGGLFGVLEAMESMAGLVGPTLGGLLFKMGRHVPLISVVVIYAIVFAAVYLYYKKNVVMVKPKKSSKAD